MILNNNIFKKDTYKLLDLLKKYKYNTPSIKIMDIPFFKNLYIHFKKIYRKISNNIISKTDSTHIITIKKIEPNKNSYIENNNFMTNEIIDECKKLKYFYIFNYSNNYIHYYSNKNITIKNIPNNIKEILILIETLKILFQRNTFHQKITIYDLKFKKKLPTKKHDLIIGPNNCNSGLTNVNLHSNGDIILYRSEELLKVCIHELMHSNLIDSDLIFSNISKYFTDNYCFKYSVLLNEAYTECISVIIHLIYISVKINKNMNYVNQLFINELKYSIYNTSKILHYYKINSILDIKKKNNKCSRYFEQNTNVFSYYFLKLILFLKINEFGNLLNINTTHYKINNNRFIIQFYDLLKNNFTLIDKYNLKLKKYNKTLRLTLYELK